MIKLSFFILGTAMFWAAMHEHPSYNEKIIAMFALAPVAYVANIESPIKHFSLIAPVINVSFIHCC